MTNWEQVMMKQNFHRGQHQGGGGGGGGGGGWGSNLN